MKDWVGNQNSIFKTLGQAITQTNSVKMKILRKFKYVKELLSCLNDTCRMLNAMQAERTERRYELYYSGESVTIDMYVFYKDENNLETSTYCTIKVFPYGDDPEYAELCAKELLDELNKEV